jgi:hypothetical protein
MPMMLELFSGTGSVGNVATEMGYDVISLDKDMESHIQIHIMDWDYTDLPPWMFDVIWASPPCTESNQIVKRTLEIIEYFKPKYWIIENPQTGTLKDQEFMTWIPYNDIDYCKYGMPYRKRTRLWNNIDSWHPKPLCKRDCDAMNATRTRHKQNTEQRGFATELVKEIISACDLNAENASDVDSDVVM